MGQGEIKGGACGDKRWDMRRSREGHYEIKGGILGDKGWGMKR